MLHFVTNKNPCFLAYFFLYFPHNIYYLYIMITLFISNRELLCASWLFFLLAMYALSMYFLRKSQELENKLNNMSDEELENNLKLLNDAFIAKASYWTGAEIYETFEEKSRRGWLQTMPSALLTSRFLHLSGIVKSLSFRAGFTYRQELSFIKKEMKKRRLL